MSKAATQDMPEGFSIIDPHDTFEMFAGPLYRKDDGTGLVYGFRVRDDHHNSGGIIHGGMLMTFGDFAICSAAIWDHPGEAPLTISFNAEFIAPAAKGDLVVADVEILRRTNSFVFTQARLRVEDRVVMGVSGVVKRVRRKDQGP